MKTALIIGRFHPPHRAHRKIFEHAIKNYDEVVVALGSCNLAPSIKNPFTPIQRISMLDALFHGYPFKYVFSNDYLYSNDLWKQELTEGVKGVTLPDSKITLVGIKSDATSWYLDAFPEYHQDFLKSVFPFHATSIRELYFRGDEYWKWFVDRPIHIWMDEYAKTPEFQYMVEEQAFIDDYKARWANAPYPPIFVTVDAVVKKAGHILLVDRKGQPGKGQRALPGGYINQSEWLLDAMLRELHEETKLGVPKDILRLAVKFDRKYDAPYRSTRGRIITHAYLIDLGDTGELPPVLGSDDADKAYWFPLSDLKEKEHEFFEDHAEIIRTMIS